MPTLNLPPLVALAISVGLAACGEPYAAKDRPAPQTKAAAVAKSDAPAKAPAPSPAEPVAPARAMPEPTPAPTEATPIPPEPGPPTPAPVYELTITAEGFAVEVGADRPTTGPDDALVTAIAWVDYGCLDCTAPLRTFEKMLDAHPEVRGALRFVPRTTHAGPASRAVLAAGLQGKLWEAHHAVVELGEETAPARVREAIAKLGIDLARWERDMESEKVANLVAEDIRVIELVRGNSPPPVFFVNGRFMERLVGLPEFDRVIAEEIPKAEAFATSKKVPRKRVYEAMRATWRDFDKLSAR